MCLQKESAGSVSTCTLQAESALARAARGGQLRRTPTLTSVPAFSPLSGNCDVTILLPKVVLSDEFHL